MGGRPNIAVLVLALLAALGGFARDVSSGMRKPAEAASGKGRLDAALTILANVPSGKRLLERAKRLGNVSELFRWSGVSRTDAILTRHFDPNTGGELRERHVTIYLRQGQKLEDLVLDVAHELTHATAGPAWDPYDPGLTPGSYIWAALESDGGEIAALIAECQVAFELAARYEVLASRCERYRGEDEKAIDREKVRRDFYRVGKWRPELVRSLGDESTRFPLLTAEIPRLYSSTGNAPYPVALLKEFEAINETACENTRRRQDSVADRSPAAAANEKFLARRCAPADDQ